MLCRAGCPQSAGTAVVTDSLILTINANPGEAIGAIHISEAGTMQAEAQSTLTRVNETASGFIARFGGGFDVYITRSVVASAGVDYVLPTGDVEDLDYLSFGGGIQYRF